MVRICVIGGGPGGLFTAKFLLHKEPAVEITVLEATPRFGGKILTKQFDAIPALYEAGVAELYHPKKLDDTLLTLLKNYGFSFIKMGGDASIYKGRIVSNIEAIKDVVGESCWKSLTQFIQLGKQHRKPEDFSGAGWPADNNHPWAKLTLREVIDEHMLNGDARMFFEKIIKSDLATEPGITNGAYGFDNYLVDDPDYCQIYTVTEGISSLVNAMVNELTGKIALLANSPVRSVKPIEGGYRVVYKNEERLISDEFDAVMVCLPVQWIPSIDFGGSLGKAVTEHHTYYYYPAHYLRVACLFKNPFWRKAVGAGSYFRLDAFGGCCVYDETSRYPHPPYGVLNWLIAGSNAEAMSNLDDDLLITRVLESLPPELANQAKELLLEGHVNRWVGSVNGQPGGLPIQDIKTKHLVDPKNHPTFVMVGDYLFDSTLNGLIDSADIGTKFLLENMQTNGAIRKNPLVNYALTSRVQKLMRR